MVWKVVKSAQPPVRTACTRVTLSAEADGLAPNAARQSSRPGRPRSRRLAICGAAMASLRDRADEGPFYN